MSKAVKSVWILKNFVVSHTETPVIASVYSLIEKPIPRFCDWFSTFNCQKKWLLWLDFRYYWLSDKSNLLQASQNIYCPNRPCKSHYWYKSNTPGFSRVNCEQWKLFIYLKVLIFTMPFSRYQAEAFYHLLAQINS